jgi:uncharacterized membrane protein
MVAEILQFEVGNLYCTVLKLIIIIMIISMMMKLGNAVVDIAASSRTWKGWSGLQAGLQSNLYYNVL